METATFWTTYIQPSLTPVVALVGALSASFVAWRFGSIQANIARQQAETARNKLKLEMFDRRFDIFEAIQQYILTTALRNPYEDASPFFREIRTIRWFFDEDIQAWVDSELMPKIQALHAAKLEVRPGDVIAVMAISAATIELTHQLDRLTTMFSPYLQLRH